MQTTRKQTKNNKNMTLLRNMRIMMLGAVAALPMWGCIRDEVPGLDDPALGAGMVRVNYTIDGMESATRATEVEGHERLLEDVHILFYRSDNESYITYQHASVTSGSSSFTFPIPDGLEAGTSYKTLIVGNAHSHVPAGYATFDAYLNLSMTNTYSQMYQKIYAERNEDHTSATGEHKDALPMWGELVDGSGQPVDFRYTQTAPSGPITFSGTVHFSRSVCRLDLRHLAAQKLIIDAVKLCNYRKAGYYFHNDAPKGEIQSGLGEEAWVKVGDPYAGNPEVPGLLDNQQLNAAIYAFPNIVPVVQQNDDQTTYLMIRGYYQDGTDNTPENPRKKLTYYRFNMAENGQSQILRRNYRYLAVINSVKGAGAASEDEAKDAETPLLDYTVDDTWTDSDSNTVTDSKGNYMTISRAMVTFDGYKDLSEAVKVTVSKGLSWSLEWDTTQGAQDSRKFTFGRVDDQQFSVTTLEDNQSDFTNTARLIVKATGETVSSSAPLTATVTVMQFSSKEEKATLMVDGQTGTITQAAPGAGATLSFQVETGSLRSGWTVRDANNTASTAGVTWTQKGANRGLLEINVPTNISAGERAFSFAVQRLGSDGSVDDNVQPVVINITQPKSDYLLTVSPSVPMDQEGLVIDGFDPTPGVNPNGISKQQQFTVMLADPENYTWTATSDFHKDYDAFLTKNTAGPKTTAAQWTANSKVVNTISGGKSGESVWLNVFRTAPGDPTFKGTLTFTAVPKSSDYATQSISITVTIKTPCTINDVLVPFTDASGSYLLVADRNVGATQTRIDQEGNFVMAGNFSNVAGMEITGKGVLENTFEQWRGKYYQWTVVGDGKNGASHETLENFVLYEFFQEEQTLTNYDNEAKFSPWYKKADALKWRIPTKVEAESYIVPRIVYSKQRPFLVSDYLDKNSTDQEPIYVGCFFPLCGYGTSTTAQKISEGYYWTSTTLSDGTYPYPYNFDTATAQLLTAGSAKSSAYNVRCVRPLTAEEVSAAGNYIGKKRQ